MNLNPCSDFIHLFSIKYKGEHKAISLHVGMLYTCIYLMNLTLEEQSWFLDFGV